MATEVKRAQGDLSDVIVAAVIGILMYAAIIWFCLDFNNGQLKHEFILSTVIGAALGWLAGVLASPYQASERESFASYGKLIYGFLSGYLISKVDPLFQDLYKSPDNHLLIYGAVFLASFLVAVPVTYITRSYWLGTETLSTAVNK